MSSLTIPQAATLGSAREMFDRDGFVLAPSIIPADIVERASAHMDDVIAGKYDTGERVLSRLWNPGDDPEKLVKIDQPHLADKTLLEFVSHPAVGKWAAAITGAKFVQVWAVQLLFKPPSTKDAGNVGWHQDLQYWKDWFTHDSELFTAWVALSDVADDCGPMRFVRGSHRLGLKKAGNFFGGNLDSLRQEIVTEAGVEWDEVPAILPVGGVSFHHRFTIHGSGPNTSNKPRRSFALHLRTERSAAMPGCKHEYITRLDDPRWAPVIYDAR